MKKLLSAFFIVTVAAVCAFAQSGPMIIITGTSIDDSSSSSSSSNTKNIDNENQKQTEEKIVTDSEVQSSVKIGDIGPGGGLVFYIEGNRAYECSEVLGKRDWDEAEILCCEYRGGGYDDWYLPNKNELNYIYQNLRKSGKISSDSWFWSSSKYSGDYMWNQRFSDGSQSGFGEFKSYYCFVLAVRSFTVETKPLIAKDVKKEQSKTNNEVANENIEKTDKDKDKELKKYKIGDIGPGGGFVFYIVGNRAYECSGIIGNRNWTEAKALCSKYHGGGYNDWYLPNKDELNYFYQNLGKLGKNFDNGCWFWSSSEYNNKRAFCQRFSNGHQEFPYKNNTLLVCAIRSFSIDK